MPDPNEPLKGLLVPVRGSDVGTWDTPVNGNFQAIGGMLGGFVSLSLSGATTIALTAPAGALTPGGGPNQQQNAMIRFSGTQTGNAVIQFSVPGFFIIDNQCVPSAFYVQCAPSTGTGTAIGVAPGKKTHIFYDGTNVDFVSPPDPGTAIDLHGATAVPAWMTACTKQYALLKNGLTYQVASFPALAAQLGSSFGGNGITTFGVPDESARMRIALDTGATNRVTAAVSGINGAQMGAAGGDQSMQSHNHSSTLSDPGHTHTPAGSATIPGNVLGQYASGGPSAQASGSGGTLNSNTTGITISNATTGSGGSQNMPPSIVSFLALIKT